jgi:putative two-component system response regulator
MAATITETLIETRSKLLVVDDVVTNIDILLEALGEDYAVRVATGGADALDSVKETLPDLILLDVMMPGMDGFAVCRCLKDDPTTRDVPIIFLTALNEDSNVAYGLDMGAVDYITKPFNSAIVKARVRNHLELKKHRDHLASLVAQRTRELAKAYERLLELGRLKDDFLGGIALC